MSHCTLICPGLLGPAVPLEELTRDAWPTTASLPSLSLILRRGKMYAHTENSPEYQILTRLGFAIAPNTELPVARLRTRSEEANQTSQLWCLDPVHVQLDREMAYLAQPDLLMLTESEARDLISSLNSHFGNDLHIHYLTPLEWLINLDLDVSTTTPSQAVGRDVQQVQARGKDARRWRTLLNEIQMLLHAHPVNTAREQAGMLPVNNLWLWGGGALANSSTTIDIVYGNDELSALAASYIAIRNDKLPSAITEDLLLNQNSLLVLSFLTEALRNKDVYAWIDGLRILEQNFLSPILVMLRQGKLTNLTIVTDAFILELDKAHAAKWWLRPKLLSKTILSLREHYAH